VLRILFNAKDAKAQRRKVRQKSTLGFTEWKDVLDASSPFQSATGVAHSKTHAMSIATFTFAFPYGRSAIAELQAERGRRVRRCIPQED